MSQIFFADGYKFAHEAVFRVREGGHGSYYLAPVKSEEGDDDDDGDYDYAPAA